MSPFLLLDIKSTLTQRDSWWPWSFWKVLDLVVYVIQVSLPPLLQHLSPAAVGCGGSLGGGGGGSGGVGGGSGGSFLLWTAPFFHSCFRA